MTPTQLAAIRERLASERERQLKFDPAWQGFRLGTLQGDADALLQHIDALREALAWICEIADKNYEQDEKLRSQGARTLARISERARRALGEPPLNGGVR